MPQRYRKFKRTWGTYYAYDNVTGNSVSLKTRVKAEADQKVNAMNEAERQPGISLGLARVYLNATDPKLATRTWQEVMEHIVEKKIDETRRRWAVAIKDKNFNRIRNLKVAEKRSKKAHVEWHEMKTGVFYLQEQSAQSAGGRGLLADKVIVSWQGEPHIAPVGWKRENSFTRRVKHRRSTKRHPDHLSPAPGPRNPHSPHPCYCGN